MDTKAFIISIENNQANYMRSMTECKEGARHYDDDKMQYMQKKQI